MPFFKSNKDIFFTPWGDEVFNENWMDSNQLILPKTKKWDYERELTIEDVDIWEQIYFESGGTGLYAAWEPYAEFYLITNKLYWNCCKEPIETFYGPGAAKKAYKKARELGMPVTENKIWVEEDEMWLYE
jgi:hypothetical protein